MIVKNLSNPSAAPAEPAWNDQLLRNPHAVADKRRRVRSMFAAIAPSYDLNNRLHSLWLDQHWRKKAVDLAQTRPGQRVVDVACGTGDLTLAFARRQTHAVGVDFTFEMLTLAEAKALRQGWPRVGWINGDALSLPLEDQSCDVVSIAFGIRNVADPAAALRQFWRILRPGGRLVILEFSLPDNRWLCALYNFYFRKVLPRTATMISRDKSGAYKYLPESVNTFIGRPQMTGLITEAGFTEVQEHPLSLGICVAYRGIKASIAV